MIYKAGETITFVAFYTASGEAKQGLADVSAEVHEIGVGVVDTPTVSEDPDGNGFYYCTYTPTSDGAYVCIFKTADATVDQKHIAGIAFRGVAGVNNLDAAISSRPTASEIDIELSSQHGIGSWQAYSVDALLLRISDDELNALLDGQSKKVISIYREDSLNLDITILDADENPIDLTGVTAIFTAREQEDTIDYIIQKALDVYDPANGKMKLNLTSSETQLEPKSYPADIEITFPDGRVKTVWKSLLEIKWDVGR
ncbi:hypothetical protein DRQ33_06485 [bacterium]|nr:MAG: hypothetical protein DRQ33_06485 [bacterium]